MADDDDEWRFSVDEVGPDDEADDPEGGHAVEMVGEDGDGPAVGVATEEGGEGDGGNVAGSLAPESTIEAGTPDLENAAFATAGAVVTVLVVAAAFAPLDATTVLGIGGAIAATGGLLYALFRRF